MRALVLAAALLLVTGACDGLGDVTDRGQELRERAEETAALVQFCAAAFQLGQAVESGDRQGILDAADELADNAPDDIRSEAEEVRDGARRLDGGDSSVLEDPDFRSSVDAVVSYARDSCRPQ